ncbi:hypothetical protein A2881_03485 [Candidatus Peribacteria bacterium RIFCSPHIGHO2_01_FULL_55_13]|nr:MAG: hypothetical protein A2881_03485 [Candidatus Peribacteria bacterium RIFCSPHIGHO2_01_FULL_55_13]OGJ66804.1 MAG: hypothetical protein A3F36_01800 [Candidatus Peribacteria bacterium RIFCSPHIGHO2_12_FULL_55_11]
MPIHLPLHGNGLSTSPLSRERALQRRAMFSCAFLILITLIACMGAIRSAAAASAFTILPDTRPLLPTVILKGIENGELTGEVRGDVRIFLGDTQIIPNGSGAFKVPAGVLAKNVRTVVAPEGMRFVASTKGKRFYPVSSKQGQGLSPKNRIYFPTAEAAKSAGYR